MFPLAGMWDDLFLGEFAHRIFDHALFLVQTKVHD